MKSLIVQITSYKAVLEADKVQLEEEMTRKVQPQLLQVRALSTLRWISHLLLFIFILFIFIVVVVVVV